MLKQCSTISLVLLIVSVVAKLAMESTDTPTSVAARNLVEKAVHWKHVAKSDTSALNAHHHYVVSLTFLQAARELVTDTSLEHLSGIDIQNFTASVEHRLTTARQSLEQKMNTK